MSIEAVALPVEVPGEGGVSGLLVAPAGMRALYVLAHGAGAGMRHPFLERMAAVLADRGIGTLRYQFPYMELGKRRPDPPAVAAAAVRAAVAAAARAAPGVPLVAGGKSFGGRMTSTAQAEAPLPGIRGLAFLGFPLHPPGRPGVARGEHLDAVAVPMLFLQGTRDEFARLELLQLLAARLGARATLHLIPGGDHSFKLPKRAGGASADVEAELGDVVARWAQGLL
jgi:predicted alpha/beta-hydrolase family hydrolase